MTFVMFVAVDYHGDYDKWDKITRRVYILEVAKENQK